MGLDQMLRDSDGRLHSFGDRNYLSFRGKHGNSQMVLEILIWH